VYLFSDDIHDWASWSTVFQSIKAFELLIRYIFNRHGLPFTEIEGLTPGTNAVFKVGGYVVKIYAPNESGLDADSDYQTELFGLKRAERLGISAPRIVADGNVTDRYEFRYFIMEYIDGEAFGIRQAEMTDGEKRGFAARLRRLTDRLNTLCERFNDIDFVERATSCSRFSAMPLSFQTERLEWLRQYQPKSTVYVHGDLTRDNVIVSKNDKYYIIDFADACIAPEEYELAVIVSELFHFEKPYLNGYFGDYSAKELTEKCFCGLLLHDYGVNIIRDNICPLNEVTSLDKLKERLFCAINNRT
jgi:Ser/Thr protein kinase RdoA (MazF antagonist)